MLNFFLSILMGQHTDAYRLVGWVSSELFFFVLFGKVKCLLSFSDILLSFCLAPAGDQ